MTKYKFDVDQNRYELRQLIMKLTMLKVWQDWEAKGGKENSKFQTWPDVAAHLTDLLDPSKVESLNIKDEYDTKRFVEETFYFQKHLGGDKWVLSDFYAPIVECITGNDGDLKYFYKCTKCGTVLIVDHSHSDCCDPKLCPRCCNIENCPWEVIYPENEDYEKLIKWMKDDAFYWNNAWYRKYVHIKIKIYYFFWKIFHPKQYAESKAKVKEMYEHSN